MLRKVQKPQGDLRKVGDEIEVRGYNVQGFEDEHGEYYERVRGKVHGERWFRLED